MVSSLSEPPSPVCVTAGDYPEPASLAPRRPPGVTDGPELDATLDTPAGHRDDVLDGHKLSVLLVDSTGVVVELSCCVDSTRDGPVLEYLRLYVCLAFYPAKVSDLPQPAVADHVTCAVAISPASCPQFLSSYPFRPGFHHRLYRNGNPH
ncbi:hypothetical protein RRG08_026935 [Elysia crispata]|uniref:Uncharacterized protein n=1 Tax=Elysia crispata TaxID=231223 RepID=A0AAE1D2M8_9GAST|nr:hypothetical protein RRG08_026935 [Elysia crispata]